MRMRLQWLGIASTQRPMARSSVTFRPTPSQRFWLDRQRRERGIPLTTLVQLALEAAMAADAAASDNSQPEGSDGGS